MNTMITHEQHANLHTSLMRSKDDIKADLVRQYLAFLVKNIKDHKKNNPFMSLRNTATQRKLKRQHFRLYTELHVALCCLKKQLDRTSTALVDARNIFGLYKDKFSKYHTNGDDEIFSLDHEKVLDEIDQVVERFNQLKLQFNAIRALSYADLSLSIPELTQRLKQAKRDYDNVDSYAVAQRVVSKNVLVEYAQLMAYRLTMSPSSDYLGWLYQSALSLQVSLENAPSLMACPTLTEPVSPVSCLQSTQFSDLKEQDQQFIVAIIAGFGNRIATNNLPVSKTILSSICQWLCQYCARFGITFYGHYGSGHTFTQADTFFLLSTKEDQVTDSIHPAEQYQLVMNAFRAYNAKRRQPAVSAIMRRVTPPERDIIQVRGQQQGLHEAYLEVVRCQQSLIDHKTTFRQHILRVLSKILYPFGVQDKAILFSKDTLTEALHQARQRLYLIADAEITHFLASPPDRSDNLTPSIKVFLEDMPTIITQCHLPDNNPILCQRYRQLLQQPTLIWAHLLAQSGHDLPTKSTLTLWFKRMQKACNREMNQCIFSENKGPMAYITDKVFNMRYPFYAKQLNVNFDTSDFTFRRIVYRLRKHIATTWWVNPWGTSATQTNELLTKMISLNADLSNKANFVEHTNAFNNILSYLENPDISLSLSVQQREQFARDIRYFLNMHTIEQSIEPAVKGGLHRRLFSDGWRLANTSIFPRPALKRRVFKSNHKLPTWRRRVVSNSFNRSTQRHKTIKALEFNAREPLVPQSSLSFFMGRRRNIAFNYGALKRRVSTLMNY